MTAHPYSFRNGERAFHGKTLAPGVARGKAYLLKSVDLQHFQNDKHTIGLVSSELARLDYAVIRSKAQISHYVSTGPHDLKDPSYLIFEAALRLLNDPALVAPIIESIRHTGINGESVLAEEIVRLRDAAVNSADELIVKGLITMQDLYYRLLYNMLPANEDRISSLMNVPAGSILMADRLTPVEVAVVPMDRVVGILIEESSPNSHSSVMARTLGVPVVMGFPGIGSIVDDAADVLIDAYRGFTILNPSEKTVKECRHVENRHKIAEIRDTHPADTSVVRSADGMAVHLMCNASNLAEILLAHSLGISEIGLFRSEIRYLSNTELPTDGQEAAYYTGIFGVEGIAGMAVRLLDLGGDKLPVYMQMEKETDPQIGCRGIRLLLSRPGLMQRQIRAILANRGTFRARLLLPFITTVDDVTKSRAVIDGVLAEIGYDGDSPQVGIMVEVPAVAFSIERFLPKVDFVCVGTNDLLQYFFAVNRDQDDVQKYNRFTHPAFLQFINELITACNKHETPLTICGEMASDPIGCCLLAMSGAMSLSVQPNAIHQVRHALSRLNIAELRSSLPALFGAESAEEVEQTLRTLRI